MPGSHVVRGRCRQPRAGLTALAELAVVERGGPHVYRLRSLRELTRSQMISTMRARVAARTFRRGVCNGHQDPGQAFPRCDQ